MIGGDIVPTENSFQEKMFMLMKEMTGASNNIAVSRLYCKAMGGLTGGVFLSQLVYWCDKGAREDGYIWKTNEEWEEETYLSKYEVTKARKVLEDVGVLETMVKKVSGNPTLHYKLLREPFIDWLVKFFTKENENLEEGKSNISLSLTKTTFPNTTTKITTTEKLTPAVVVDVVPFFKFTDAERESRITDDFIAEAPLSCIPTIRLPGNVTTELLVKLETKWSPKHGGGIVQRQMSNLKAEMARNSIADCARWLTAACKDDYVVVANIDLYIDGTELADAKNKFKNNEKLYKESLVAVKAESMAGAELVQTHEQGLNLAAGFLNRIGKEISLNF